MKTVCIKIFDYENDLLHVTRIWFSNWTTCYRVSVNATINAQNIYFYVRNKIYNFPVFQFKKKLLKEEKKY